MYFYAGKASSHGFQRSTYSGQQKRHLVKFMPLYWVDGHCLDTLGPFFATEKDITITNHIITTKNASEGWYGTGDVMIVDRGFRNVAEDYSRFGYEPKMPIYLPKRQKQHTTKAANKARLVTKVPCTIESHYARFKKWQFSSDKIENQLLPKLEDCV